MFKLEAVRALHGEALLLHYRTAAAPKYALIDGCPATVRGTDLHAFTTRTPATPSAEASMAVPHRPTSIAQRVVDR